MDGGYDILMDEGWMGGWMGGWMDGLTDLFQSIQFAFHNSF